jgi:predicted Zn-dependent protease
LRLGAAHLAAGHYAEAENVFRDLVTAGDPLPTGYIGLAQVLLRTGHAAEAASELASASQKLGPNFLISYFRGLALDRAGKPLEALTAFQESVRLSSDNAEVHLSLGKTELGLGRVSDAIAELQEALRLRPDNVQAKRLLSKAYGRAGDSKRAAAFAEAKAPTNVAGNLEDDLLGDFFVPQWQMPPDGTRP